MTLTQDQIAQLKKAQDLVIVTEFEKTRQGRRPLTTTYSSRRLGLEYREKYTTSLSASVPHEGEPEQDASFGTERTDEGKEAVPKTRRPK